MEHTASERLEEQLCRNIPDTLQDYMKALQFFDEDIDDYLYIYDLASDRIYFTNKIYKRFPLPVTDDMGMDFREWDRIIYPKDRRFMEYYRKKVIDGEVKSFHIACRIIDFDGNKVWVNVKGTMRERADHQSNILVGRISEMVVGRVVDGLTGLCSTEKFMEDLKEYQRLGDGYLMILGADNFKYINITQGRAVGDEILMQIAAAMDHYSQYPVSLYRLDGDCFAAIFPKKQKQEIDAFYHAVQSDLHHLCTISAGAVPYSSTYIVDSSIVYQYAENALDQAKKEGKNALVFFSHKNYQKDVEQIELLDEIKASIEQNCNGFFLCYQPQVNSRSFEIAGVEVLLRYNSPSRGSMSPADFIPLLEKSGLICPVGEWVLKTALQQCREWRKTLPNLRISVNLSQVQLQQIEIADIVLDLVRQSGLPGDALMLEVTESIQLQDYIYLNKIFYTWKQHGIQISIDDFGTGYSSLSYLKSIEIDEVKIDRCFVDHVQCNAYNYRLLRNMIELAHSAKITVCCEGVETYEEFLALQELHTDLYQGYLFAKPYTKQDFEQTFICADSEAYAERKAHESYLQQLKTGEHTELLEKFRKEEISNITESMEEVVYISDVDTYELYYLNAAGRRITGVYDYKGQKCYRVLKGCSSPCEDCTNHKLCENEFYVWESENPYLKKKYILKDKLIRWQGKMVRLEIAIDVTNREIVSKAVQRRLDFEKAIVDSCRILASENTPEQIDYNVVRVIGEFSHGKRAYILKYDPNTHLCDLVSEWLADSADSIQTYFPMTLDKVQEENSDRRIASLITRRGKIIGLVGVDFPTCKEDGYDLVKAMAYFLGYSMIGEENQQQLNHLLESRYGDIRNHTDLGLWEMRIDPVTGEGELFPDKILCRLMEMDETLPPKDSYHHWYSRINEKYYDYVNHMIEQMIQSYSITHVEYPWNSPLDGDVMVHCVGIRREDCDGKICLEGYHWMVTP